MKKRLFIAIPLAPDFKEAFVNSSKRRDLFWVRWTVPENLHITVCFLGGVEESLVARIIEKLEEVLTHMRLFSLEFKEIVFAPPGRPPQMIWGVFKRNDSYSNLAKSVERAMKEFIETPSDREQIPHVTLARFKNADALQGIELSSPGLKDNTLQVRSCELVEAKLFSAGPIYTLVKKFQLND